MRSPFSFSVSKEISQAVAGSGHRPEALRRQTLADNARIAIAVSALAIPASVYFLIIGIPLPFVMVTLSLASGMITLTLHTRKLYEQAAAGQVYTILLLGLLMTLVDRNLGDMGMAVTVLAPVLAALQGRKALRTQSWVLAGAVLALGTLASMLSLSAGVEMTASWFIASGTVFAASLAVVVHAATRIGGAYEVYDKSQVNAYRHLIEHVQDAVIRFSSDGELLLASRSSEKLFGCQRYELTGSGLGERLHVLDRPLYLTAFADANQGGQARTIEVRMRRDDPHASAAAPTFIWVEVCLSPVLESGSDGMRHEVVALLRDITERKDDEALMAEARRVAEEASSAKSRFLATIGHELRTPLNAVVGFSEMMSSGIGGELSPTHQEYAGLIHQSGKHLLEVVRMLLDMSRLDAGKFELQTERFQLPDLIEPCFSMVGVMARERDIRLVADVATNLPLLLADERACRQILINLLSNAVKFSQPHGTVTVSIKRQGQSLNLSVTDHGIGMAPESLARVGEPFFQVHDGLNRRYEGTGLGLSIVKGLVDLHDGTLRAMSEIGTGTTMTVLLPINGPAIKAEETATVTPIRKEPVATSNSSWLDEKRKAQ
ncbi:PAS domain-containing sensor histidine kinase [Devosia sp. FKR38]|uniref:PAS domain-containing sensor histidine kinase n=1 Tax=Devosia sp. FKR38 TaxID=2562312 RepID=UPI0010C03315|nr:PAS domain-containing sensor histidine kinase [Devosia sp. FKR38]